MTTTSTASATSADHARTLDEIGRDVLGSVSRVQDAALSVSRDWIGRLAEYVPAIPGTPANLLEGPAHLVDQGFDVAEEAIGGSTTFLGDAVHRQRDFVMDVFGALQPVVNALAGSSRED